MARLEDQCGDGTCDLGTSPSPPRVSSHNNLLPTHINSLPFLPATAQHHREPVDVTIEKKKFPSMKGEGRPMSADWGAESVNFGGG